MMIVIPPLLSRNAIGWLCIYLSIYLCPWTKTPVMMIVIPPQVSRNAVGWLCIYLLYLSVSLSEDSGHDDSDAATGE
jgi:hypothetical protein